MYSYLYLSVNRSGIHITFTVQSLFTVNDVMLVAMTDCHVVFLISVGLVLSKCDFFLEIVFASACFRSCRNERMKIYVGNSLVSLSAS